MRLAIAESAVKLAIDHGFASTGPDAERFHLAMTHPEDRVTNGVATMLLIRSDPDEWETFAQWCSDNALTVPGDSADRKNDAAKLFRAARRIRRELRRLAAHPGYRGVAVAGCDRTVLPARRCGEGRWWPTTRMALAASDGSTATVEAVGLHPHEEWRRQRTFTVWSPEGDRPCS